MAEVLKGFKSLEEVLRLAKLAKENGLGVSEDTADVMFGDMASDSGRSGNHWLSRNEENDDLLRGAKRDGVSGLKEEGFWERINGEKKDLIDYSGNSKIDEFNEYGKIDLLKMAQNGSGSDNFHKNVTYQDVYPQLLASTDSDVLGIGNRIHNRNEPRPLGPRDAGKWIYTKKGYHVRIMEDGKENFNYGLPPIGEPIWEENEHTKIVNGEMQGELKIFYGKDDRRSFFWSPAKTSSSGIAADIWILGSKMALPNNDAGPNPAYDDYDMYYCPEGAEVAIELSWDKNGETKKVLRNGRGEPIFKDPRDLRQYRINMFHSGAKSAGKSVENIGSDGRK